MSFEINSGDEFGGDVCDEGQEIKMKTVGKPASQKELEEHMLTHIPYRSCSPHCISGRGQSDHHRQQLRDSDQEVPTISLDYAFLGETGSETD